MNSKFLRRWWWWWFSNYENWAPAKHCFCACMWYLIFDIDDLVKWAAAHHRPSKMKKKDERQIVPHSIEVLCYSTWLSTLRVHAVRFYVMDQARAQREAFGQLCNWKKWSKEKNYFLFFTLKVEKKRRSRNYFLLRYIKEEKRRSRVKTENYKLRWP